MTNNPRSAADPAQYTRDAAALIIFALAVRGLWLWLGSWTANDSIQYVQIAANLVDHWTFSLDESGVVPTAFRPPLFPAVIALIWSVAGKSVVAVLVFNAILGSLTVGLTYLVARQRFGRSVSVLAGAALALAPMTALFTVTPMTESLFTFLTVVAIFAWGSDRYLLAGIAFGLAALTRPLVLPLILILALLPLLPRWRPLWRSYAVMVIVAISVIGVWTARNAIVLERYVPIVSAGAGVNLLCGTLETDTGGRVRVGDTWVPLDLKTNPVTGVDGDLDEFETDRIRRERAIERITGSPGAWIIARVKQYPKLYIDNGDYLLGDANLPIREAFSRGSWGIIVFKGLFIGANLLVMILALVGVWWVRKDLSGTINIWLFPLLAALIHLPMWIEPRYFLPMMPMVFILAAVGLHGIFKRPLRNNSFVNM